MLFRMVEQGADMDVVFDKGKKPVRAGDVSHHAGEDALWAVFMTKDLWKKGIWYVISSDDHSDIEILNLNPLGLTLSLCLSSLLAVYTPLRKFKALLYIFSWMKRKKFPVTRKMRVQI